MFHRVTEILMEARSASVVPKDHKPRGQQERGSDLNVSL